MFWHLTMAVFRLYMTYLVSSYRRLNMGCTQWGGWEVWVHGVSAIICISELIIVRAVVSYYVCCRNYMYIHILILYIYDVHYYTRI